MANRSHIYTCDEVPGGKGFYARGLSEFNYDIPLVHKLMVATNPRIVRSAIWEHDIGILGDREGAFERSLALLEKVGEGDLTDRKEFDEELAGMKEFLATTPPSKYILLEAGEILDMMGDDLNALVADLHAEIAGLAEKVDRAIAGDEDAWIGELRSEWQDKCRPGYWSDILYYSFEQNKNGGAESDESDETAESDEEASEAESPAEVDAEPEERAAPAKKAAKKPAKKATAKKPAKKAAKKPAKKAAKKPAKKAAKKPAKAAKKPAKKAPKKSAKKRKK